ncbi:hypothetical protein AAFF_G00382190 [Aldrovandia affinis]|uniref:Uncharacterized protein n=1 Tax=Aldrovandia affinis TaxID=143900 RepID=A0AAD7T925_9TELE|nr:hypothetical protein AAFF_G00382190 [Aldrovandia affinis]
MDAIVTFYKYRTGPLGAVQGPPHAGPHIANGWGQPVRLRHLYAARQGLHLQMNKDGKPTYAKDDCSFLERILADGYSIYVSGKHGEAVSLSSNWQRLQEKDRGMPSQFLPMTSILSSGLTNIHSGDSSAPPEQGPQPPLKVESMDPFGKLSQIFIQSPSFS